MSPENDLEQLRRDVQYLMDRQARHLISVSVEPG